jgi:hypothetical protein
MPIRQRAYYEATIAQFLQHSDAEIISALTMGSEFSVDISQREAWIVQIALMRAVLAEIAESGRIHFEFAVPRIGKRIDVLLLLRGALLVLEFKVGAAEFHRGDIEQVWDYALDLKNFHSTSHNRPVVPILVATQGEASAARMSVRMDEDGLYRPICAGAGQLMAVMRSVLGTFDRQSSDDRMWSSGSYLPTPTIIDAARALYGRHGVAEISRSDAGAANLTRTSGAINELIAHSQRACQKSICFVTGVPGAGKTLVGLNTATEHSDSASDLYSVFLSGNGPLVSILREALARDKVQRERSRGTRVRLGNARSEVKAFIQNVHHFRDEYLRDATRPPAEHVVLFDEAQRAWNVKRTTDFMRRKKNVANFAQSEPEFLVSCMDRHVDWAVIVCLVGGGQEINTGEAGIAEWIRSIVGSFPDWHMYLSPNLHDSEFAAGEVMRVLGEHPKAHFRDDLHLGVSLRSFRAERVSELVKRVLDLDVNGAQEAFTAVRARYPIVICRSVERARNWLREKARGTERFGLVVSSQAQRLKPHAIDVRAPLDPVHWFLDDKNDVRSSYYLEDAGQSFTFRV